MHTYPVLPSRGYAQLRIFNGVPQCQYRFITNLPEHKNFTIDVLGYFEWKYVPIENGQFQLKFEIENSETDCPKFKPSPQVLRDATAHSLFLQPQQPDNSLFWYEDHVEKSSRAMPLVRTLANTARERVIVWRETKSGLVGSSEKADFRKLIELRAAEYEVLVDDIKVHQERLRHGGVYALVIGSGTAISVSKMIEVTEPNSMNIFWLLPQYIIMTLGEVMFSVTGLEFSYSQSPVTMKSVLQACWLLTVAFGNILVVIIAELKFFMSQASEFFLFAAMMFVDMLIFMWLAYRYKSNDPVNCKHESQKELEQMAKKCTNSKPLPKYSKKLMEE